MTPCGCVTHPPEKRPTCSRMDQVLNHSSASHLLEQDSKEMQLRVDFFRKLGYSSAEVKTALTKLGLNTDTNSVLGELVRCRTSTAPARSGGDSDERSTGQKDSLLPASWALGPCRNTSQTGEWKTADTQLRPVVVDGSNVAMR